VRSAGVVELFQISSNDAVLRAFPEHLDDEYITMNPSLPSNGVRSQQQHARPDHASSLATSATQRYTKQTRLAVDNVASRGRTLQVTCVCQC
jgi:hypothetical protein